MSTLDATVAVTLRMPQALYERVTQAAQRQQRTPEAVLNSLVTAGLERQAQARELLERASASYCARLEREGKLNQTPEEIFAELAALREEIANELYPD